MTFFVDDFRNTNVLIMQFAESIEQGTLIAESPHFISFGGLDSIPDITLQFLKFIEQGLLRSGFPRFISDCLECYNDILMSLGLKLIIPDGASKIYMDGVKSSMRGYFNDYGELGIYLVKHDVLLAKNSSDKSYIPNILIPFAEAVKQCTLMAEFPHFISFDKSYPFPTISLQFVWFVEQRILKLGLPRFFSSDFSYIYYILLPLGMKLMVSDKLLKAYVKYTEFPDLFTSCTYFESDFCIHLMD